MGENTLYPMVKIPAKDQGQGQEEILKLLNAMCSLNHHRMSVRYKNVSDFLWQNGLFFNKMVNFHESIFRYNSGKMKQCYFNAHKLRQSFHQILIYVEGMAIFSDLGIAMNHAWCITNEGFIVDPTWKNRGVAYFGLPIGKNVLTKLKEKYSKWDLTEDPVYLDDWKNHWPLINDESFTHDLVLMPGSLLTPAEMTGEQFYQLRDTTKSKKKTFLKKIGKAWASTQELKELKADEMAMKGE